MLVAALDTRSFRNLLDGGIEPGGAKDAAQMVQDFLGRPYSFEAYRAWLAR